MHALVVEDDFASRTLLCRLLEPVSVVDVAVNGSEALRAVDTRVMAGERYDLVCLDIMMPGMNGHETLRRFRALEERWSVPAADRARIIMTTSLEDRGNVMRAYRGLCDGYLVKPVTQEKLREALIEVGLPVTETADL